MVKVLYVNMAFTDKVTITILVVDREGKQRLVYCEPFLDRSLTNISSIGKSNFYDKNGIKKTNTLFWSS